MGDTNYFSGIVKILETPKQRFVKNNIPITTVRVEVPQNRKNKLISLMFWGNLGGEVKNFYTKDDYILIEGYLSLRPSRTKASNMNYQPKKIVITVLKIAPILLNPNRSSIKREKPL